MKKQKMVMTAEIQARIDEYARSLRVARREAGDPSYVKIAKSTAYSKAQICRILNGKSFPRWDFVKPFLEFCEKDTTEINTKYRRQWREITNLLRPIGEIGAEEDHHSTPGPEPASGPTPGLECPECGALVANQLRHHAWHTTYIRRVSTHQRAG